MKKAEKVLDIINILQREFPNPPVPLDHKDDYTLLIAVFI